MTLREREILIASVSWTDKSLTVNEEKAFPAGARWAGKTMSERACEWVYRNWREYIYQDGDGEIHFGHWESDFRKAMEEE